MVLYLTLYEFRQPAFSLKFSLWVGDIKMLTDALGVDQHPIFNFTICNKDADVMVLKSKIMQNLCD